MKKKTKLEKKKEELEALRIEVLNLEDAARQAELKPAVEKLEGKFFKYRNCYSCPQGPQDYWWLYSRVNKVKPNGWLECLDFEIDKDGHLFVRDEKHRNWETMLDRDLWIPVTPSEWDRALELANVKLGRLYR